MDVQPSTTARVQRTACIDGVYTLKPQLLGQCTPSRFIYLCLHAVDVATQHPRSKELWTQPTGTQLVDTQPGLVHSMMPGRLALSLLQQTMSVFTQIGWFARCVKR